jgi:hypothetical protein
LPERHESNGQQNDDDSYNEYRLSKSEASAFASAFRCAGEHDGHPGPPDSTLSRLSFRVCRNAEFSCRFLWPCSYINGWETGFEAQCFQGLGGFRPRVLQAAQIVPFSRDFNYTHVGLACCGGAGGCLLSQACMAVVFSRGILSVEVSRIKDKKSAR